MGLVLWLMQGRLFQMMAVMVLWAVPGAGFPAWVVFAKFCWWRVLAELLTTTAAAWATGATGWVAEKGQGWRCAAVQGAGCLSLLAGPWSVCDVKVILVHGGH